MLADSLVLVAEEQNQPLVAAHVAMTLAVLGLAPRLQLRVLWLPQRLPCSCELRHAMPRRSTNARRTAGHCPGAAGPA